MSIPNSDPSSSARDPHSPSHSTERPISAALSSRARASQRRRFRAEAESLEERRLLAVVTVTSALDAVDPADGVTTLREAIIQVNAITTGEFNGIEFRIPGRGTQRIQPNSTGLGPLPVITNQVYIDGFSQPTSSPNTLSVGDNSILRIELDGSLQQGGNGLVLNASNSTIRGLSFHSFSNVASSPAMRSGAAVAIVGDGGAQALSNHIYGNHFGFDSTGEVSIPNNFGVALRDRINLNAAPGVVAVNYIGFNPDVDAGAPANRPELRGVFNEFSQRNLISSSNVLPGVSSGILLSGAGTQFNYISGNYIGTDRSGQYSTSDEPGRNGRGFSNVYGIRIQLGAHDNVIGRDTIDFARYEGDAPEASRNVIGGTLDVSDAGILLLNDNNPDPNSIVEGTIIAGNFIGVRADGSIGTTGDGRIGLRNAGIALGAAIGDPDAPQRISDNLIGSNLDGHADNFEGNQIGGNFGSGILLFGAFVSQNEINLNQIHSNDGDGILLTRNAHDNRVERNTITGNTGAGVALGRNVGVTGGIEFSGPGNVITENSIFANGGLGIDWPPLGITTNGVPFPIAAVRTNGSTTATFGIEAFPSTTYVIEYFANDSVDPTGFGEGQKFLTSQRITTGPDGRATFTVNLTGIDAGQFLTATATSTQTAPSGMTGEFSLAIEVIQTQVVTTTQDSGPGSLRQAILDSNARPGLDYIYFDIAGPGAQTIQPNSPLPMITDPVIIDGYSQPTASPNTQEFGDNAVITIEINGDRQSSGNGLVINTHDTTVRGLSITGFDSNTLGEGFGILITGDGGEQAFGNRIEGNFVGVRPDGTTPGPNAIGVGVESGTGGGEAVSNLIGQNSGEVLPPPLTRSDLVSTFNAYSQRNLISGNNVRDTTSAGVQLSGGNTASAVVAGNYIGTDRSGLFTSDGLGNVIGVAILNGANGNLVGFDDDVDNAGTVTAVRNLIAGGDHAGILIAGANTNDNRISGNFIGLRRDGSRGGLGVNGAGIAIGSPSQTANLSGTIIGTDLDGQHDEHEANQIVDTQGSGVQFLGSGVNSNVLQGNAIAFSQGPGALIRDQAHDNVVRQNGIHNNAGNGVALFPLADPNAGDGNEVTGNSIFANGGLAIDRGGDGVSVNSDTPNNFNAPIITAIQNNGATRTVQGTLNNLPNTTYRLEFYTSSTAGAGNTTDPQFLAGAVDVTTDSNGAATFASPAILNEPARPLTTAVAINIATGDTTEAFNGGVVPITPTPETTFTFPDPNGGAPTVVTLPPNAEIPPSSIISDPAIPGQETPSAPAGNVLAQIIAGDEPAMDSGSETDAGSGSDSNSDLDSEIKPDADEPTDANPPSTPDFILILTGDTPSVPIDDANADAPAPPETDDAPIMTEEPGQSSPTGDETMTADDPGAIAEPTESTPPTESTLPPDATLPPDDSSDATMADDAAPPIPGDEVANSPLEDNTITIDVAIPVNLVTSAPLDAPVQLGDEATLAPPADAPSAGATVVAASTIAAPFLTTTSIDVAAPATNSGSAGLTSQAIVGVLNRAANAKANVNANKTSESKTANAVNSNAKRSARGGTFRRLAAAIRGRALGAVRRS